MAVAENESELIERCRSGDRAAFGDLVLEHQDRVYNLAYRLTNDPQEAEDITQEAFLKAFRSIARFEGSSRFYTWIYRITVNAVVSRRRYHAVRPQTVPLGRPDGEERQELPPDKSQPDPSDEANRADVRRLVEEAIQRLDEEHRVLIVLRDIEGRDYGEIAEILDCPRGTVKSRLHRARIMLKDLLASVLSADSAT
jgi:RNA polymerase sigma-70 factor (ECF subfamily)